MPLATASSKSGQLSVERAYLTTITIVKKTMHEIEKPDVYPRNSIFLKLASGITTDRVTKINK